MSIERQTGQLWSQSVAICIPDCLKAGPDCVRVAHFSKSSLLVELLTFDLLAIFSRWSVLSGSKGLLEAVTLSFDPVRELVEDFLGERQLSVFEKLRHLSVNEVACVFETALCFKVITEQTQIQKS